MDHAGGYEQIHRPLWKFKKVIQYKHWPALKQPQRTGQSLTILFETSSSPAASFDMPAGLCLILPAANNNWGELLALTLALMLFFKMAVGLWHILGQYEGDEMTPFIFEPIV